MKRLVNTVRLSDTNCTKIISRKLLPSAWKKNEIRLSSPLHGSSNRFLVVSGGKCLQNTHAGEGGRPRRFISAYWHTAQPFFWDSVRVKNSLPLLHKTQNFQLYRVIHWTVNTLAADRMGRRQTYWIGPLTVLRITCRFSKFFQFVSKLIGCWWAYRSKVLFC